MISPSTPQIMNTKAMPRSIPVPNQLSIASAPEPVVMNGMKTN